MNDLESLLFYLKNDYVKGRSLEQNLAYQLFKKHALKDHHRTLAVQELLLAEVVKTLKDPHVRLERIADSRYSLDQLYEHHFRSIYKPSVGMPTLHSTYQLANLAPRVGLWSNQTLVWQIPSLHVSFIPHIESLFYRHQQQMEQIPYWIIDLRGNSGGTDRIWPLFWPYLSSGLLLQGGTAFRATKGNQYYFALAAHYARSWQIDHDAMWYEEVVRAMQERMNHFVIPRLSGFSPMLHLDHVKEYPKRFVVLIDQDSASSAESLIEMAKQSFKGMIIGQSASMGCTDSGNLRYALLPSRRWALYFGTSIHLNSYRVAVDRGGYQPDILLPQGDPNLVIPWVDAYLRNETEAIKQIYQQFSLQR